MSIQWTLVAGVLYFEIGVIALLMIPFLKPRFWHKFFKSKFLRSIESQANLYFMVFIVILVLLFLDSIREMQKYSTDLNTHDHTRAVGAELNHSMKLFRAQRNFYLAGIALFLFLVIRRLVTLVSALAQREMDAEVALKQAKSASDAAKNMMAGDSKSSKGKDSSSSEVSELKKELEKARKSEEAVKKQAETLTKEYERLLGECKALNKKLDTKTESKKDN